VPRDAVLSETPLCDLIFIVPVTSLRYLMVQTALGVYRAVPVRVARRRATGYYRQIITVIARTVYA